MQGNLFSLPLPMLTFVLSAVAAWLTLRTDLGSPLARILFTTLFITGALASFLVGLRFGYGVELLAPLQRLFPLITGPLLFSGFHALTTDRTKALRSTALHTALIPAAILALITLTKAYPAFDLVITASYAAYAAALLLLWRKGADTLTKARLELATPLHRWIPRAAALLLALLILDSAIALSFMMQREETALSLISFGALIMIAALGGAIYALTRTTPQTKASAPRENALVAQADALLTEKQLFKDAGLTVDRLARRLGVPARALSEAVNQSLGINVSQYVNNHRLHHAAQLLRDEGLSASKAMEHSGFLSRSNFYREFQRVYGMTPAAYRNDA